MSNATTSDNSNNSANERRIHVRNLALMRSINTLKLHIDIVQDRIRDISGALVKARDQLIKIDTDLQSLADETGVLKDDLQEIKRQQDLRNVGTSDGDGADSDDSDPDNGHGCQNDISDESDS